MQNAGPFCVWYNQHIIRSDRMRAKGLLDWRFTGVQADLRLEPLAAHIDERNQCNLASKHALHDSHGGLELGFW